MLQLLFTSFKPPEPILQKLLEPIENFSNFISWAPLVVEFLLFLAAVYFAIWYKKKQRGIESKSEYLALKKHKKMLLEEVESIIAVVLGLSFIGAMYFLL